MGKAVCDLEGLLFTFIKYQSMIPLGFRLTLKNLALAMFQPESRRKRRGSQLTITLFRRRVVKQCPDIIKNLMPHKNEMTFPGGTGFNWNGTFLPSLKEQHEVLARRIDIWDLSGGYARVRKDFSCFHLQSDGRKLVQRSAGSELMHALEGILALRFALDL